jgi:protein phosphatase
VGIAAAARSDIGLRRELNEDGVLAGEQIWVVADGMGGHAAGDIASAYAIASLSEADQLSELRPTDIVVAIATANQRILDHARVEPQSQGMGTTIAGIASVHVGGAAHWAIFNVGDSRVYRVYGGALMRATVDHSETEEMVMAGTITDDEARNHPLRNVITRSVGSDPAPQVDLWVMPQTPGERFLVCSDGITTELTDERIAAVVLAEIDPRVAVDRLVAEALAAGGRDNTSAIIVDLAAEDEDLLEEATLPRIRIEEAR